MDLHSLIVTASNFGFPIMVTCYLLVRIEGRLSDLENKINDLTLAINKLSVILSNH